MSVVNVLQDWLSVISIFLTGIVWWFVKLNSDKIKEQELAKQEIQHTKQQAIETERGDLDLDQRRIEAAEDVASRYVEKVADLRKENLEKEDELYEKDVTIKTLVHDVKDLKWRVGKLEAERDVAIEQRDKVKKFYCNKEYCPDRDPKLGTYDIH